MLGPSSAIGQNDSKNLSHVNKSELDKKQKLDESPEEELVQMQTIVSENT